jgi:hypothetical protein
MSAALDSFVLTEPVLITNPAHALLYDGFEGLESQISCGFCMGLSVIEFLKSPGSPFERPVGQIDGA